MTNTTYANPFTVNTPYSTPSAYPSTPGTATPYAQSAYGTANTTSPYGNYNQNQNLLNAINNLGAQNPQQPMPQQQAPQPQFDPTQYVTKEDYESLLNEKRALQEKLESELAQRVDIEFFKMEQEMLTLPEGARLAQELEYQKNRFFDALWKTSEPGKNALMKYRESIQVGYDKYRADTSAQMQQAAAIRPAVHTAPVQEEDVF